jgi:transcriptional regulator GlxA family with amidase domain
VSVCTGAFLLAEAGLLTGRRVTTHWGYADTLAQRHPEVEVDAEPIFIRDAELSTSAGVTAGIDLALDLVEARAFTAEVGIPPGRYVDRVGLEAARRRLEDSTDGIAETARACGYGTPEAMRRAFPRVLALSPAEYRRRFQPGFPPLPRERHAGSLTGSPHWTRSARTRCSAGCPAPGRSPSPSAPDRSPLTSTASTSPPPESRPAGH